MAIEQNAIVVTVPAPVGGWNQRDPLETMPITDAPILDNFFPAPSTVKLRNGSRVHATGVGSGRVETLASYMVGTNNKILAAGGGAIYNATAGGGVAATSLKSGFTNNQWQTTLFNAVTIWVNGFDQPQQFDGTTVTDAVYTGTGLTADNAFINVSTYRNRLYFVENLTLNAWYTNNVDALTGGTTKFSVANVAEMGGHLIYAGPWNTYASGIQQNTFVFITSNGEAIVYTGSYPGDSTWYLVGRYTISHPIGFRSQLPYVSDQICMLMEGAIPLSLTASPDAQSAAQIRINDKIAQRWNDLVAKFYAEPGWSAVYHPRANMFLFNLPVGSGQFEQHVQNVLSGAWARFIFKRAECWLVHDRSLFYGDNAGRVIEADTGQDELGDKIYTNIQLAFNDLGDPDTEKRLLMAQPTVRSTYAVDIDLDVDLDEKITPTQTQSISVSGGTPWMSPWMSPWSGGGTVTKDWRGIYGIGKRVSLKTSFTIKDTSFEFSSFRIMYERGGVQ
jgi:hypothetical protein